MATQINSTGDGTDVTLALEAAIASDPNHQVYLPAGPYHFGMLQIAASNAGGGIIKGATAQLVNHLTGYEREDVATNPFAGAITCDAEDFFFDYEDRSTPISPSAGPSLDAGGAYQPILFTATAERGNVWGLRTTNYSYKGGAQSRSGNPYFDEIYTESALGDGVTQSIYPAALQCDPGARRAGGHGKCHIGRIIIGPHPNAGTTGGGGLKFAWYDMVQVDRIEYVGPYAAPNGFSLVIGELVKHVKLGYGWLPGGISQYPGFASTAAGDNGATLFDETVIDTWEMDDVMIGQGAAWLDRSAHGGNLVYLWNRPRVRKLIARRCPVVGIQRAFMDLAYGVNIQHTNINNDGYLLNETSGARFDMADYIERYYFEDCRYNTMRSVGLGEASTPPRVLNYTAGRPTLEGRIKHKNTKAFAHDGSDLPISNDPTLINTWLRGAA